MDRSLKFFLEITNKYKKNRDNKTGLSKETKTSQTNVIKPGNDPYKKSASSSTSTNTTTNIKSLLNDRFFVNYLGNSSSNKYNPSIAIPEESDISLSSIIKWSSKNHPSMKLKPEDFVYLKAFRSYPANRLMVLRRFTGAIGHDLFSSSMRPLSTLVTYIPEGEMPVKITFNEKWKSVGTDLTFMSVLQNLVGIDFTSIPGIGGIAKTASSPIAQDMINKIGQKMGFLSNGGMPYGDPNIIYDASIRDVDGSGISSGLQSDVSITFETTYLFQEINGVDAKAAMLDIIGNILVMGTSPERFLVSGSGSKKLNELINDFKNGNIGGMFNTLKNAIYELIGDAFKTLDNIKKNIEEAAKEKDDPNAPDASKGIGMAIVGEVSKLGSAFMQNRYSRYKWQLAGLLGTTAGFSTAPWHVTIGNPKAPWFTSGNMVIDSVELIPNDVIGYNDYFTELTVKIKLKQGRSMGLTGISDLFNNGRGRIYIPESQLKKIIVPPNVVDTGANYTTDEVNVYGKRKGRLEVKETQISTDGTELNLVPFATDFSLDNTEDDKNLLDKINGGIDKVERQT